jgi:DNA mismatch repair ATPase MutS
VPGLATRSFGVWVGKLAGLPQPVLDRAQAKGDEMRLQQITKLMKRVLQNASATAVDVPVREAVQLLAQAKSILAGRS